jgi:rare lipoprotein A
MYSMTAAHPTLPLPSYVRVTNLENGRAAIVRINDRGPFKGDRIIDLSYSAARKLGIWQNGTAYVEVRAITPPRNGDDADRMMLAEAAPQTSKSAPGPVIQRAPSADSLPAQSAAVGLVTTPLPASSAYASQPVWQEEPRVALALVPASVESPPAAARATPPPVPATIDYESSVAAASPPIASTETGTQIFIQVGAFSLFQNADSMRERLTPLGVGRMEILPSDLDNLYRLRLGPIADQGEALRIIAVLDGHGFPTHRMIQEPSTNANLGGVQKLNVQAF